ncbi:hypothetical protein [Streptomyces hainanensis]|uniref:Uncharacterized protein n=1 Tax=Streptomyces hainanensis TaxID=402648 RepID=A0A4R4T4U9_9ACTN|nr:hypothetical protein [Streptomyces hainanensis]TDC70836.1 hypothetical protein E1283_24265 [Streptomyces hainanensis]
MTDYEDRLVAMLADLRGNEAITVYDAEEGPLATWLAGPEHALEVIGKVADLALAPSMAGNFHRYGDLSCYWRATEDTTLGGETGLNHLVNACVGWVPHHVSEADWPASERGYRGLVGNVSEVYGPEAEAGAGADDDDDDEEGGLIELVLHGFDGTARTGDGAIAGFRAEDGVVLDASGHPEIWYSVNTSGTLVRLDLSYPEYLETLLLTRGLHGWQYLFADPHDPGFPEYFRLNIGPHLDFIARAFPHDDFSALRARYEAFTRAREEDRPGL